MVNPDWNRPTFCYQLGDTKGLIMLATIRISSHIQAQGILVKRLANGMIVIRAGQKVLTGRPISKRVA